MMRGYPRYPPTLGWDTPWTWDGVPPWTWDGVPPGPGMGYPPQPGMGYPHPRHGMGYPPIPEMGRGTPPQIDQHSEHLLRVGRYASCVHAGGLSCCLFFSKTLPYPRMQFTETLAKLRPQLRFCHLLLLICTFSARVNSQCTDQIPRIFAQLHF